MKAPSMYGSLGSSDGRAREEVDTAHEDDDEEKFDPNNKPRPTNISQDYRYYLEDVDALGWFLVSDPHKLACYSRFERFCVGLYTLMVNMAIGTCIRSLNTCNNPGRDPYGSAGMVDALIWCAVVSCTFFIYEFAFLIPLFRYILMRRPNDAGVFEKVGFTGRFCNVFIWVPIVFLGYVTYGFMTATQGAYPKCKYKLYGGHFRMDGLLTGLWIFWYSIYLLYCYKSTNTDAKGDASCSVFVFGYIQRLVMSRFQYQGTASNCLFGILSFFVMGEIGVLPGGALFPTFAAAV